jgi:hypothetical protein
MSDFVESTLDQLYTSAVQAFPRTRFRQHATDPIRITELQWIPYLGMKTLYLRGRAQNIDNHHEYQPIILFKNVRYHDTKDQAGLVEIVASDEKHYLLERLGYTANDVLLRCDCKDFHWRFNYYDHIDHSLYGRKRSKYEAQGGPPANPRQMPGMCKHLMKMVLALDHAGVVA